MQLSNQYNSFLGGEVSESLWYRADMDKFGKWFANAENIRFTTMGGFENRPGFVRVGPVLDHQLKPVVKLIPFVFNNEEVFEIEFITGKFRVRKHGEVIKREDGSEVVYNSPIKIESLQQLKYAQSGDIIFIASGTSPVMELRRLKTDGTEWELIKFNTDLLPVGDDNYNTEAVFGLKKVIGNYSTTTGVFDLGYLNIEQSDRYYPFTLNITQKDDSVKKVKTSGQSINEIVYSLNSKEDFRNLKLEASVLTNTSFSIKAKDKSLGLKKVAFTEKKVGKQGKEYTLTQGTTEGGYAHFYTTFPEYVVDSSNTTLYPSSVIIISKTGKYVLELGDSTKYYGRNQVENKLQHVINEDRYIDFYKAHKGDWNHNIVGSYDYENLQSTINLSFFVTTIDPNIGTNSEENKNTIIANLPDKILVVYAGRVPHTYSYEFGDIVREPDYALVNSSLEVLKEGDLICIKHTIDENSSIYESSDPDKFEPLSFTSDSIISDGKWRFMTSGNWLGNIQLEYSKDKGKTWTRFRTIKSNNTDAPYNDNSSGDIETEDTILIRFQFQVSEIKTQKLLIQLFVPSFETNSYYILLQDSDKVGQPLVACVKNDIGLGKTTSSYKIGVFSEKSGYPESIGFYQNRLFLAKGYELWGSRINDFWDFYEPVELQKDDPINMSILTYKVNTIKNILTTKSFFVFTTGGEFGIASQGALSQDDKFLKQFSSHGSNDCTPLVVGNIVLFVDSTGNTVRAFQYSFEADNYEATDISLFVEQKLKGKQIVTTEYIRSTKECLFLDADGIVWVFKYMPEQNIMSWSHWKHGQYKITNLCVTPNGAYDELYIVVDAPDGKFIERLDASVYSDSVELYNFEEEVEEVQTQLIEGQIVNVDDGINNKYKATVGELGKVKLRSPSKNVKIGLSYTSTGTLLTPTVSLQDGSFTTYRKQRVNKVFFIYKDSFGFKVGEENKEKMEIEFRSPSESIENSITLSSGKKSVLVPDTYDSNSRVSFVQDKPYPMSIINVLLESDYGGQ